MAYFGIKTKLECFNGFLPFSVSHYDSGGKLRMFIKPCVPLESIFGTKSPS